MARSRNIKPSFFLNEEIVELDFSTRLLFIGLWTLADREGRLDDKPKKIKMALFPADDLDINSALNELEKSGFIKRYIVNEAQYIQILTFKKHQNPHIKEPASTIPAPCEHHASTMQAVLIPDSPLLIPDSVNTLVCNDVADECPHEKIIALYHKHLPMLTKIKVWNAKRQTQLRTRWREDRSRQNLEYWERLFIYISKSDFLTGKAGNWQADLEWITNSTNFTKIIEGKYENKAA